MMESDYKCSVQQSNYGKIVNYSTNILFLVQERFNAEKMFIVKLLVVMAKYFILMYKYANKKLFYVVCVLKERNNIYLYINGIESSTNKLSFTNCFAVIMAFLFIFLGKILSTVSAIFVNKVVTNALFKYSHLATKSRRMDSKKEENLSDSGDPLHSQ